MVSYFPFLDLPRELRDQIYEEYVRVDGGYKFSTLHWKLQSERSPKHPFALQRTCKLIHEEMEGLALRHNTITFSSANYWPQGISAGIWQKMMCTGPITIFDIQMIRMWAGKELINDNIRELIARQYPCFLPHLDWLRGPHPIDASTNEDDRYNIYNNLGERPSLFREYVWCVVNQLTDERRVDTPWAIYSEDDFDEIESDLYDMVDNATFDWDLPQITRLQALPFADGWSRYRYSAATYAISFLTRYPSCPQRNIILDEHHASVVHPECHARGLIEFCSENPLLRIERRVNLVMTVLSRPVGLPFVEIARMPASTLNPTTKISIWISEALDLPPAISLVFIGGQTPRNCNLIFESSVIPNARSRDALEEACARGIFSAPDLMTIRPTLDPFEVGSNGECFHKGVAKAIRKMVENKDSQEGQIRCNFDPGSPWNVEDVIKERKYWSNEDWVKSGNWKTYFDNCGSHRIWD